MKNRYSQKLIRLNQMRIFFEKMVSMFYHDMSKGGQIFRKFIKFEINEYQHI